MQTFLPYQDFHETAACLDDKRLVNQAHRECQTLLNGGWANHPASKMWQGYRECLLAYQDALMVECYKRGFASRRIPHLPFAQTPWWLGNQAFHDSHKASLYAKSNADYLQFSTVAFNYYLWPDNQTRTFYKLIPWGKGRRLRVNVNHFGEAKQG